MGKHYNNKSLFKVILLKPHGLIHCWITYFIIRAHHFIDHLIKSVLLDPNVICWMEQSICCLTKLESSPAVGVRSTILPFEPVEQELEHSIAAVMIFGPKVDRTGNTFTGSQGVFSYCGHFSIRWWLGMRDHGVLPWWCKVVWTDSLGKWAVYIRILEFEHKERPVHIWESVVD